MVSHSDECLFTFFRQSSLVYTVHSTDESFLWHGLSRSGQCSLADRLSGCWLRLPVVEVVLDGLGKRECVNNSILDSLPAHLLPDHQSSQRCQREWARLQPIDILHRNLAV